MEDHSLIFKFILFVDHMKLLPQHLFIIREILISYNILIIFFLQFMFPIQTIKWFLGDVLIIVIISHKIFFSLIKNKISFFSQKLHYIVVLGQVCVHIHTHIYIAYIVCVCVCVYVVCLC